MTVTPDWLGPDDANDRLDDINNIREHMWYTLLYGILNNGFLVPGWNMKSAHIPTLHQYFYTNSETGVVLFVRQRWDNISTMEILDSRCLLDRKLGDGYESWADTTGSNGEYTVNPKTNVIEKLEWAL